MAEQKVVGEWTARIAGRVKERGLQGAAKESLGEMKNAFTAAGKGARGVGFARTGAVGVGATMAMDAIFRSQSNGEDRSGWTRLAEGVGGLGMMAGGLLAGGR